MSEAGWKQVERRVGALFGVRRTPLSGGASAHTTADLLHPYLYVEVKHLKNIPEVEVYRFETKRTGSPLLLDIGGGVVIGTPTAFSGAALTQARISTIERSRSFLRSLLDRTEEEADREGKVAVVVVRERRRHGLLIAARKHWVVTIGRAILERADEPNAWPGSHLAAACLCLVASLFGAVA